MSFYLNTAEGQSAGTTLTAGNSGGGSGDAFDQVVKTGSGAVVFSDEQVLFGTQSYKITSTTGDAIYLMYDPATTMTGSCQMLIYVTAYPDVNQALMFMRTSGGSASVCAILITTTGAVRFTNATGTNLSTSSAGVITLNTWIRLDMHAQVGSTTSNGRAMASASLGNSPVTLWSYDSGYTTNLGTAAIGNYCAGKIDTTPVMATFYVDDITASTGVTDFIPPRPIATSAWFTAS